MRKRIYFALLLMSCCLCLSFMSSTYSRYVAGTQGNISMYFAKWQILVNDQDIADENVSEISITPTIEQSVNVRNNVMAPTSKGYFDIDIDASNVDMSYRYTITLSIDNEDIPDLLISKYAILPEDYEEGDTLEYTTIQNNEITNTVLFDNETEDFAFEPFTIRVYFEWYDGDDEEMDDEDDTAIGLGDDESFSISASITFEQVTDSELEDDEDDEDEEENPLQEPNDPQNPIQE